MTTPERISQTEAMRQHARDSRELRELCTQLDAWRKTARQQAERIADLEAELMEQARLNGMGSERELALMAERDQHKATSNALLALLADIRKACGDKGTRMQPELVEFIGAMSTELDQLLLEVERLRADAERYQCLRSEHQRPDPVCHLSWERNGDRSSSEWVNTADLDAAIDAARTTHNETE